MYVLRTGETSYSTNLPMRVNLYTQT